MDYDKYYSKGWGVSIDGLKEIERILDGCVRGDAVFNILEFGSGFSTMFFVDYIIENRLNRAKVVSFENNEIFAMRISHPQLDLRMRSLLHCSDEDYEEMFEKRVYMPQKMRVFSDKPSARQRNCFYKINYNDIPDVVDFMLLDGPNGNGRNIAYLHVKDTLHPGTIVFIDDYDHYDFMERFGLFWEYDVLCVSKEENDHYVILKVVDVKF